MESRRLWWVAGLAVVLVVAAGGWWAAARGPAQPREESRASEPAARPPAEPRGGPISDGVVPKEPGTPVELPSADLGPADLEERGMLDTRITLGADGCVVGAAPGEPAGQAVGLLWPAGWTAQLGTDGRVEVLDAAGRVVLRDGDRLQVGGGEYGGSGTWQCRAGSTVVFAMEDTPRRLG